MRLGVNIDHIATVRQARRGAVPDPVEAARRCEAAGCDSIVCHLREDRRHINERDVRRLREAIATRLNLEMSIAPDIVKIALAVRPWEVTLVPERRQELTTEGGLDVVRLSPALAQLIGRFHQRGIRVSLFVDPVASQLRAAKRAGAKIVELHTGRYADARTAASRRRELEALRRAARLAQELGFGVAAGHGLDYENVTDVVAIPEIVELNIGFSIIARSVFVGIEQAVGEMKALMSRAPIHAESVSQA
jgi:pyridoxine 5-phosphate synthase